jgi:ankyrin repeat protein
MHYAAEGANSGFIAKLARAGARVDIMDRQGFTPLMYAARSCKYWNVPALIEAGANPRRALDALPNEAQYLAHGTERNCRQTYQALTSR